MGSMNKLIETNQVNEAIELGKKVFRSRSKKRTHNTFYNCRSAVGRRREKNGLFYMPRRQVLNYKDLYYRPIAMIKRMTKGKTLSAFDFVALHAFMGCYFELHETSWKRYNDCILSIRQYCCQTNSFGLRKQNIIWGYFIDDYFYEGSDSVTTLEIMWWKKGQRRLRSIEKAIDRNTNQMIYLKSDEYSKVNECELCNRLGAEDYIFFRDDVVYHKSLGEKNSRNVLKYGTYCEECYKKIKPLSDAHMAAQKMRILSNKAMALHKENRL